MSHKPHYKWTPDGPVLIGWRIRHEIKFIELGNGKAIFPIFPTDYDVLGWPH